MMFDNLGFAVIAPSAFDVGDAVRMIKAHPVFGDYGLIIGCVGTVIDTSHPFEIRVNFVGYGVKSVDPSILSKG